jgi:hypothetical protein
MIDWFVLFAAALALVPIVLLFAFVGCVLDREGKLGPPINLTYQMGLEEIDTIEASLLFVLDNDGKSVPQPPPVTITNVNAAGDTVALGNAPFESTGTVTCTCVLTTKTEPPFDAEPVIASAFKTVAKAEDEPVAEFKLFRDGTGGFEIL